MRRSAKFIGFLTLLLIVPGAVYVLTEKPDNQELLEKLPTSGSYEPGMGLPSDWFDCVKRHQDVTNGAAALLACKTYKLDGMTTELFALKIGDQLVPVLESRSEGPDTGIIVIDITGGPGGEPFYLNSALSEKSIEEMRRLGGIVNVSEARSIYFRLLERGFTIVSIGYWGTNLRTLNAPDEIELAMSDVKAVVDFYRDDKGAEPSLLMTSLGNHLALGALGKDRIQAMTFLALVPVMDGLQHHLKRVKKENEHQRLEAEAKGNMVGEWRAFNVYRKTERGVDFDYVKMLPVHDFVPQFTGDADFAWRGIAPKHRCSKIVLGNNDPRTRQYLNTNSSLPPFISVLESDHDPFKDAPKEMHKIFGEFANCLMARAS